MRQVLRTLPDRLSAPVDIAVLVAFRLGFGAVMVWEAWRFLSGGKVDRYFIEPTFFFKYLGFGWVEPWPGGWMYFHFYVLGALGLCIALFAVGYTYFFLIDQAQYQNHYYLICLVSTLMILVPAHRALSLDAQRRPDLRSSFAPAWSLWLLRAQVALVYFFGGVAKLNFDWLRGYPLREWLPGSDFYVPPLSDLLHEGWVALLFSYSGLLIDLLAAPLLLWRPTRYWMLSALLLFHFMNEQLFSIGVFPVLASALTLLFLRHWLYPGNVSWTEEGHRYAWHMKLRDKDCTATFELVTSNP